MSSMIKSRSISFMGSVQNIDEDEDDVIIQFDMRTHSNSHRLPLHSAHYSSTNKPPTSTK